MPGIKIVVGLVGLSDTSTMKEALSVLEAHGVKNIDTAHLYGRGQNEIDIGNAGGGDGRFIIDSKNRGGWTPGVALERAEMLKTAREGLAKLKPLKQLDVFYIHAPDATKRLEEWVPTIQELHDEGLFRLFGLSNFSAEQVKEVYDFCKAKGYILPTVYQGNYSPVARKQEQLLFPTLRELGMSFYAYSPLAGGFLTKTKKQLLEGTGTGRFTKEAVGGIYPKMYQKPAYLDALDVWEQIAESEGCSKADLAYRWVSYHSPLDAEHGDAIIIGGSKVSQLESSLLGLEKGPLKPATVKAIGELWTTLEHEAPLDNFQTRQSL